MKLTLESDLIVLAKLCNPGKDDKKYYSVSVFDPETGESGSLSCNEMMYNALTPDLIDIKKLVLEFNDKYGSLRVVNEKL